MKLTQSDAELFFKLMLELQWYVCNQEGLHPQVKTFKAYQDLPMDDKVKVRNYLFAHPEMIDQFVQENPGNFDSAELAIVASWKNFIQGDFFVERLLKKYSVFIRDDDTVYGVLGLSNGLDELIDKRILPIRVKAILLPFKDIIISDGLFNWYNISFGGGIKASLKQAYLIAKDNDAIIESLSSPKQSTPRTRQKSKAKQDWTPLLHELADKTKKLKGGSGQPATYSPIFSLVRASIDLAQLATEKSPNTKAMLKKTARIEDLVRQINNSIWRMH